MTAKPKPDQHLSAALGLLVSTIEKHGNWDDGCFYYNGTSASELQEPLRLAKLMLNGGFVLPCSVHVEGTTISKGCDLSALLVVLMARANG